MVLWWALPLAVGVSSARHDASLHAPHGHGLSSTGAVALLDESVNSRANGDKAGVAWQLGILSEPVVSLAPTDEHQLHRRNESENATLQVLNATERHDRMFPVAWSLGALGALAAAQKREEPPTIVPVYNDSDAANSSLPGLNESEASRRFFSPFSWQLGAMSAHPSAQAQQGAQNNSQLQQEQSDLNMTTEDR